MNAQQEAVFEKKAEQLLRGHRGLQNGRDFRWNTFRFQQRGEEIDRKFDDTFPFAPGSDGWWDRFCSKCERLKHWCKCE